MTQQLSIRMNKRNPGSSRGFSLIELLIVIAIILIIAAIAIPSLLRSRMAANEASAVQNLRTITTAAVVYNTTYQNGFPQNMQLLGGPGPTADCDAAILLDAVLTTPPYQKAGYTFAYTGGDGSPTQQPNCSLPGFNGYLVTATPIVYQTTGERSFCANEPAIVHFDVTGTTAASENLCVQLPALQ